MSPDAENKRRTLRRILKRERPDSESAPVVLLAPMAGITDSAFRALCVRKGCEFTFTEMVSASGLHYNNRRTRELISIREEERPCGVQLFGHDPAIIAETVGRLFETAVTPEDAAVVDINMGCPAPKITGNGDGSALMRDPVLAGKLIEAAVRHSPVPVSVKFRKGWDDASVNAVEFARMAEESGAAFITVHGRTRMQMYSGTADRELIARVVEAVSIPVVGNGDVFSGESAVSMIKETGCAGVMAARGAQGNPFIFEEIRAAIDGREYVPPTVTERLDAALEHIAAYMKEHGGGAFADLRKHAAWYTKGMYGSTELRRKVNNCADGEELIRLISEFREMHREFGEN
ncbi:MAG: tRNA dihydrouridine synthase DusB [Clostridia bacterium]|nr:tRNA dihydrouridine synthase DusB [Clostridia bacterium]